MKAMQLHSLDCSEYLLQLNAFEPLFNSYEFDTQNIEF